MKKYNGKYKSKEGSESNRKKSGLKRIHAELNVGARDTWVQCHGLLLGFPIAAVISKTSTGLVSLV